MRRNALPYWALVAETLDGNSFKSRTIGDTLNERYYVAFHLNIFDFQEAPDKRVIFNRVRGPVQQLKTRRILRRYYTVALRRAFEEIFWLHLEGLGEVAQPAGDDLTCPAFVFLDLARRDADSFAERPMTHGEHEAPHQDAVADIGVDRIRALAAAHGCLLRCCASA